MESLVFKDDTAFTANLKKLSSLVKFESVGETRKLKVNGKMVVFRFSLSGE